MREDSQIVIRDCCNLKILKDYLNYSFFDTRARKFWEMKCEFCLIQSLKSNLYDYSLLFQELNNLKYVNENCAISLSSAWLTYAI